MEKAGLKIHHQPQLIAAWCNIKAIEEGRDPFTHLAATPGNRKSAIEIRKDKHFVAL